MGREDFGKIRIDRILENTEARDNGIEGRGLLC